MCLVLGEIEERRQWLADMIKLGRGDTYKRQIQNEIAVRFSRLTQLKKMTNFGLGASQD